MAISAKAQAAERSPSMAALRRAGAPWLRTGRADPAIARSADRHYSRKTIGGRRFDIPGKVIHLYVPGESWPFQVDASWVWWRGLRWGESQYQGWWSCAIFRNESTGLLSSDLVRAAVPWAIAEWGWPPLGFDTYVDVTKVQSSNPGYCYLKAVWRKGGWSKDGKKRRLYLPASEVVTSAKDPSRFWLRVHWALGHRADVSACRQEPCPAAFRAVVAWLKANKKEEQDA